MTIEARVIADSVSPAGARITTFELRYPRVIHAEFMTHRAFSRNASSSRAIPWEKMKQWVTEDPYVPIHWGKNQKGMQATDELLPGDQSWAKEVWLKARSKAVLYADVLANAGIHKQIVNRLIEPFAHINVVCTATDYCNWFALRMHEDAMPEIQCLAVRMARAMAASEPTRREAGEWHLPYVDDRDLVALPVIPARDLAAISAARCARVSYLTHGGERPSVDDDLTLFRRLMGGDPRHASPSEHQARALDRAGERSGNFRGWQQHRQMIAGHEAPPDFDWRAKLAEYGDASFIV